MKTFYHFLANNLVAGITNFTVWFAIVFFAYLQTKSVFATALISGIYTVLTAGSGFWLGSLVDHYPKKKVMILSSFMSFVFYGLSFLIYISAPEGSFSVITSGWLWSMAISIMLGVIAGNLRNIALPTAVSFLVDEDKRDKANGMIGTTSGISFLITSVISGFLVGQSGMWSVLVLALITTSIAGIHLLFISVKEKVSAQHKEKKQELDLKGTWAAVTSVPGLLALIFFTTFNNFLGGVFMSLMDAYGLSMVSVETWGLMWGFLSTAFIVGGLIISKWGLGKNPVKSLMMTNVVIWTICCFFTAYPSIILLVIGMFIYLCVVPFIEASEHTIIQKVVPKERLGRVFGFAQSVEQSASPITSFAIGPITQFIFIPFMTTGAGVKLIGSWFGTGPERGIALVFTLAGIIGLGMTLIAFNSKYYRQLSKSYAAH